jgi:NADPH:quinone reductase-like Zn-dependent oxidoreductase
VKKPTNLSFTEAFSFPLVYGTAYLMMKKHDVKAKKVSILGGSTSVGKYIVQLAKIRGAKIIETSNSPRSNDLVKRLGSINQIDYTKNKTLLNPVLESVKESGKFDYIYDTCGNSDSFSQISSVLAPKSTSSAYITCVGDGKYDYGNIHLLKVVYENFGVTVRSLKAKLGLWFNFSLALLEPELEWIQDAKNNFEQGNLEVSIDSVHKWHNFNDAVDKIKYNKPNGKVVVETEA